jgi:hypothetical protein
VQAVPDNLKEAALDELIEASRFKLSHPSLVLTRLRCPLLILLLLSRQLH